jgi:hypothetical protein
MLYFYTHVHADVDVIFTKDVTLPTFGELPQYFTMGVEARGEEDSIDGFAYGNAGVMLMNLVNLRRSYVHFLDFIFSDANLANGLHFGTSNSYPYNPCKHA